jgi:hypothetical protein
MIRKKSLQEKDREYNFLLDRARVVSLHTSRPNNFKEELGESNVPTKRRAAGSQHRG